MYFHVFWGVRGRRITVFLVTVVSRFWGEQTQTMLDLHLKTPTRAIATSVTLLTKEAMSANQERLHPDGRGIDRDQYRAI